MTLKQWLAEGWLVEHKTAPQEISLLLHGADRDIATAQVPGLSVDWKLAIAYNAALQCATAALAACGYRAGREAYHYRTIQSLAHTMKMGESTVGRLNKLREKRHDATYRRAGQVSDQEAEEMVSLGAALRQKVEEWLRAHHPTLVSKDARP